MKNDDQGISRRQFLGGSLAVAAMGLVPERTFAQAKDAPPARKKSPTRVILLGTGGGPRTNKKGNHRGQPLTRDIS